MKIEINEDELALLIGSLHFETEMRRTVCAALNPRRISARVLLQKLKDINTALSAERGRKMLGEAR